MNKPAVDLCDPAVSQHYKGHKDAITSVDFNPNGRQLASSSLDGTIMVWNYKVPQARVFRFSGHTDGVTCIKFSPSGHLLASSSRDRSVRLWVPSIKGENHAFKAHSATVRSVDFSLDGEYLATASDDKCVKVWSTHRQKFQFSLNQHTNWVRAARFSPDSSLIASCSDDKTSKIWDTRTKECVHTFYDNDSHMHDVQFHVSGTCVVTGLSNGGIKLWDCRVNKLLQSYQSHDGCVNSVAFHPNGDVLLSASNDSTVKIHDLKEGRLIYTLHGHQPHSATAVTFSKSGSQFASAGSDNQILIWDTNFADSLEEFDDVSATGARKKSTKRKLNHVKENQTGVNELPFHTQSNVVPQQPSESFIARSTFKPIQNNSSFALQNETQTTLSGVLNIPSEVSQLPEVIDSSAVQPVVSQPEVKRETRMKEEEDLRIMEKLELITNQMDILTQTVAIIEQRLTNTEDKLNFLMENNRTQKHD